MPFLTLKLSRAPSPDKAARLVATLTDVTADVLRKKRELTVVAIEALPALHWSVGGAPRPSASPCGFLLEITVTQGTNTQDEKAAFVARAFAAIETILGAVEPTSYVVVHEVPADAWGYGGRTQAHRLLAGRAALPQPAQESA